MAYILIIYYILISNFVTLGAAHELLEKTSPLLLLHNGLLDGSKSANLIQKSRKPSEGLLYLGDNDDSRHNASYIAKHEESHGNEKEPTEGQNDELLDDIHEHEAHVDEEHEGNEDDIKPENPPAEHHHDKLKEETKEEPVEFGKESANEFGDRSGDEPASELEHEHEHRHREVDDENKDKVMSKMQSHGNEIKEEAVKNAELANKQKNDMEKEITESGDHVEGVETKTVPKGEGNIIITNKMHTTPRNNESDNSRDPIKQIRDATLSLFQRAKQKNLPVEDAGVLDTPEQIYAALNTLEYVIDEFRHSRLESPNPYLNTTTDNDQNESQTENSDTPVEDMGGDTRLLQISNSKKDDQDLDFPGEEDDEHDEENEEEYGQESEQENEEEDDHYDTENKESISDAGDKDSKSKDKNPKMALESLKVTINDLIRVLGEVIKKNTGVSNVVGAEATHS